MSYGYLGDTSTSIKQQVKNAGVLSMSDVVDLKSKGHLGGSLELIESQTFTTTQYVDFTSIKGSGYDVHCLQFSLTECTGALVFQISNDGGSTFETTGYKVAYQYGSVNGTFGESRGTNAGSIGDFGSGGSGKKKSGYIYFYNLNSSDKYSLATGHGYLEHPTLSKYFLYGSGIYPTTETHDAIRLSAVTGTSTGTATLFGIKQI